MLNRRVVLGLGAGLAITAGAHRDSHAQAPAAGRVTALVGRAKATAVAGSERGLAEGDAVRVADLVETAAESRIGMTLGAGTIVNLGPSTKLKLDEHIVEAGGTFELVDGAMLLEHVRSRGAPPGKAEVRSPYGLMAVRGTRFFAGPSGGTFGVFVADGRVDVTGGGRTVVLLPGWGTDVARPGAPPSEPRAWGQARIRAAYMATLGRVPRP